MKRYIGRIQYVAEEIRLSTNRASSMVKDEPAARTHGGCGGALRETFNEL
jgi:hypothetical protein